jgi:hypothetical protein
MTTTVRVLIEGNKECEVKVVLEDGTDSPSYPARNVKPGSFTTVGVHGEQTVSVKEVGDFLN